MNNVMQHRFVVPHSLVFSLAILFWANETNSFYISQLRQNFYRSPLAVSRAASIQNEQASTLLTDQVPSLSSIFQHLRDEDFRGGNDQLRVASIATVSRFSKAFNVTDTYGLNPSTMEKGITRDLFKNPEEKIAERWRAPFLVSSKTQALLKKTFENLASLPLHDKAIAVLSELLRIPSQQINEFNVVYALTLSAKCMHTNHRLNSEFRKVFFQVMDILKYMIENKYLGARQLCNSIHAIAKFYNADPTILPIPPSSTEMSSLGTVGVAESWILKDEDDNTPEYHLQMTVDLIACSILSTLEAENYHRKPSVGELSMACWAFGVLRQRSCPPGWIVPPQLSRLPANRKVRSARQKVQLVTFEQWAVAKNDKYVETEINPVAKLLDAIGDYLCQEIQLNGCKTCLVSEMSWSEMANVAWAFASNGHCRSIQSESLMIKIAQEASNRLLESSGDADPLPRDISQLVWSIGALQSDNFRLGEDLVKLIDTTSIHYKLNSEVRRPFENWSSADLVQISVAMAHGRIDKLPLLIAVFDEARLRLSEDYLKISRSEKIKASFQDWEVSVLLWVQARLYLKEEQGNVFEGFLHRSTQLLELKYETSKSLELLGIGPQEQANLAWSLTVLEAYKFPHTLSLLKTIFKEASGTRNEFIQLEHAHQLWQALFLLEYECPEAVVSVPSWFRDFLKDKWSVEKARQKNSSARHRSLSQTLDSMGVAHFNEHVEDIDVAIVLKNQSSWTSTAVKSNHQHSHLKVGMFSSM
jgi:hypothetical protein